MKRNTLRQNAKWIILCRLLQSFLQLLLGMVTARYLGPSDYGLISYAASVTAFASVFVPLGLNETLVREYISSPEQEGIITGTALAMSFVSGVASMTGVSVFAAAVHPDQPAARMVCILYSFSLVFQCFDLLQYWFHAKLRSRYPSLVILASYGAASVYKILLLLFHRSVYWFALIHCVEYAAAAVMLMSTYRRQSGKPLQFSLPVAKAMFRRSKYYILSGMMVTVFQNTDHIMLRLIEGDAVNGQYTAAVTCAGMAGFVYNAVIDSARPVVLESMGRSREAFEKHISCLYCLILCLTLTQSICFFVLAEKIMGILYGEAFLPAASVLRILVWQLPFSRMGSVRNVWILAEEKHGVLWYINLSGALANVILNAAMIPVWGAEGAAFASVLTQCITNFVIGFLMKPIRENNRLLLGGMTSKCFLEMLKLWCS